MTDSAEVAQNQQVNGRTAGAGAAQRVDVLERRLAEKREEMAGLKHQIFGLEQNLHRWRTGLSGERLVGALLDGLADAGWVALHDLTWPGRKKANLDHVLVGPGGVVVIDTKNWSAPVAVRLDGVLQVGGTARATTGRDASTMTSAVAAVLPPRHRTAVAGVLCFAGQPLVPATTREGVVVLGDAHLTDWIRGLQAWLAPEQVREIYDHLRRELGGSQSPEMLTTADASLRGDVPRPHRGPGPSWPSAGRRPVRTHPKGRRALRKPASTAPRPLALLAGAVGAFGLVVGASQWMPTVVPGFLP